MELLTEPQITAELATVPGWTNHHPDVAIAWNKVTLTLSTHSAGGLTANDFALARQISSLD